MNESSSCDLTDEQREVKTSIEDALGYWNPQLESLLQQDLDFARQVATLSTHSYGHLPRKVRELMFVAIYSSAPTTTRSRSAGTYNSPSTTAPP